MKAYCTTSPLSEEPSPEKGTEIQAWVACSGSGLGVITWSKTPMFSLGTVSSLAYSLKYLKENHETLLHNSLQHGELENPRGFNLPV